MIVFEVVDKTGRLIRMTRRQWKHIVQKHPDLSGKEENIKMALRIPDVIISHRLDKNAANYYRHYKNERSYLLVSVRYLNGDGFVITSFYTRRIRR